MYGHIMSLQPDIALPINEPDESPPCFSVWLTMRAAIVLR